MLMYSVLRPPRSSRRRSNFDGMSSTPDLANHLLCPTLTQVLLIYLTARLPQIKRHLRYWLGHSCEAIPIRYRPVLSRSGPVPADGSAVCNRAVNGTWHN